MKMGRRSNVLLVLFAALAVVAAIFLHAESFRTAVGCAPAVREQIVSPDNRMVAVVFEMECGATVGFNTQLATLPINEINSLAQQSAFLVLGERKQLDLRWLNEKVLAVRIPNGANIFRQEQPKLAIQVVYD
jgi:hypothetical protein